MGQLEKLVGGAICYDVGVHIHDLAELRLLPQVDFGEGGMQIWPVHEV